MPTYAEEALADGPAALYLHNDTTGTTATDSSGNGRHGTYVGGVTLADTTDPALGSLPHVRFDGSTGYLQLPAVAAPPSGWLHPDAAGMTVEVWVRIRTNRDWARLVDFSHAANTERLYIVPRTNAGQVGVHSFGGFYSWTALATGSWQLVTLTVDATGVIRFHVNGTEIWYSSLGNPFDLALPYLYIGKSAYGADPTLDASIGPVAVYNYQLSTARVAAHASATLAPPPPPAIAGQAWGAAATMLDGTPRVGLRVAGDAWSGAAAMLDGTIPVSVPITVAGEAWSTAATALDGTGHLRVTGESWSTSANFPNGNIVGAAIIATGEAWSTTMAVLDGFAFTPPPRNGYGLVLDSSAVLTVDDVLEPVPPVPAGTPSTVLHIVAPTVPVPTLVAGRPL